MPTDLSQLSDQQLQQQLQDSYDTLNQAGVFKDPEYQQVGHQLRATGFITDPTQGGTVAPLNTQQSPLPQYSPSILALARQTGRDPAVLQQNLRNAHAAQTASGALVPKGVAPTTPINPNLTPSDVGGAVASSPLVNIPTSFVQGTAEGLEQAATPVTTKITGVAKDVALKNLRSAQQSVSQASTPQQKTITQGNLADAQRLYDSIGSLDTRETMLQEGLQGDPGGAGGAAGNFIMPGFHGGGEPSAADLSEYAKAQAITSRTSEQLPFPESPEPRGPLVKASVPARPSVALKPLQAKSAPVYPAASPVHDYIRANPTATPEQVVAATKVDPQVVAQAYQDVHGTKASEPASAVPTPTADSQPAVKTTADLANDFAAAHPTAVSTPAHVAAVKALLDHQAADWSATTGRPVTEFPDAVYHEIQSGDATKPVTPAVAPKPTEPVQVGASRPITPTPEPVTSPITPTFDDAVSGLRARLAAMSAKLPSIDTLRETPTTPVESLPSPVTPAPNVAGGEVAPTKEQPAETKTASDQGLRVGANTNPPLTSEPGLAGPLAKETIPETPVDNSSTGVESKKIPVVRTFDKTPGERAHGVNQANIDPDLGYKEFANEPQNAEAINTHRLSAKAYKDLISSSQDVGMSLSQLEAHKPGDTLSGPQIKWLRQTAIPTMTKVHSDASAEYQLDPTPANKSKADEAQAYRQLLVKVHEGGAAAMGRALNAFKGRMEKISAPTPIARDVFAPEKEPAAKFTIRTRGVAGGARRTGVRIPVDSPERYTKPDEAAKVLARLKAIKNPCPI